MTCGGLIAEPGKNYGYAGKFCDCATPRSPLRDIIDKMPKVDAPSPFGAAVPAIVSQTTQMSAADFVMWLRGYLAAKNDEPALAAIVTKLTAVVGPK